MAALTESSGDILRHLNWGTSADSDRKALNKPSADSDISPEEKKVLSLIEENPGITTDALNNLTGLPISKLLAMLLEMELKEWISAEPGNRYRCRAGISL